MIRRVMLVDNSGMVGFMDGLGWLNGVGVGVSVGCGVMVGFGVDVGVCFNTNQVQVPGLNPLLLVLFGAA